LRAGITLGAVSDMARFSRPDTAGYLEMARHLVEHGNFGNLTGRVPLFPLFCSGTMVLAGNYWQYLAVTLLLLVSVATIYVVWLAAKEFKEGCENAAAWLLALNITAVANAPMLLTDTLFGLFAAVETLFIFKFIKSRKAADFLVSVAVAALGTLLRPINLLFPFCALCLLLCVDMPWKKRLLTGAAAVIIALGIVTPWMFRNAACQAGFTIDTNTGAMYHQNGAMLISEVNKTDFESEKAKLIKQMSVEFSDKVRYSDEKSREEYRVRNYRKLVLSHPFIWFKQQLNFATLLPDAPTFLELAGATTPNRGTMGVLAKEGVFAAVKHYFGGKIYLILLLLPLLAVSGITLAGAAGFIADKVRLFNRETVLVLVLFALLIWYYLFLPGAISAPRYHIPALPCACAFAGCFLIKVKIFLKKICKKR
jgi:hypothetical protein